MLILNRRLNTSIVIGGNVTVKVVSINGFTVKLGIEAPPDVTVHRKEIQNQIDAGGTSRRREKLEREGG